jgi:hypothetical protein
MSNREIKLRLALDVTYRAPTHITADELQENLLRGTMSATELGMLTDRADVEVESKTLEVIIVDAVGLPACVLQFQASIAANRPVLEGICARYAKVVRREGGAPGLVSMLDRNVERLVDDLVARVALEHPDDVAATEAAQTAADNWVTEHVTSDLASRLAAVFWLKGVYQGMLHILRWLE